MTVIATNLTLGLHFDWATFATHARRWMAEHAIEPRDAIVLLPFAQLLPPARRAWAELDGWMPRIETTQTLAASLAPARPPAAGQISFDSATDRLIAARLLRGQAGALAWAVQDAHRFEQAVLAVVELAQAMARAAFAMPVDRREAYWGEARGLLVPADGPGASERLLARVALEWAAAQPAPQSDRLFVLQPSAWIVLGVGAPERWIDGLLACTACPTLRVDANLPLAEPFDPLAPQADVDVLVCHDFEDEAQRTAARVLQRLNEAAAPVALIAQDRSLVRRVRALLERRGVPLLDETGWRLSTTRAAARTMALLRSMSSAAAMDELLDWLKSGSDDGPALRHRVHGGALLEQAARRHGWAGLQRIDATKLTGDGATLWADVQALRTSFAAQRSRSLLDWCQALRSLLAGSGDGAALEADEAGIQLLAALHLDTAANADGAAWLDVAGELKMGSTEFQSWVDATLDQSTFIPSATGSPKVVITPMARAMLRPFGSVVLPGADERRLGSGAMPLPLLGDAEAVALGLNGSQARRDAELLAFAQLLRLPRVTVLRRRREGSEPLAASPLLERLLLSLRRAGRTLPAAQDDRPMLPIAPRPTPRPMPTAARILPDALSASAVAALRACPYRFYALYVLGLREQDELDDTIEKRDYGNWLHAVLFRFHGERPRARDPLEDLVALQRAADEEQAAMAIDAAEFLPYSAAFDRFAPHYVEWLQKRDAEGAHWRSGEQDFKASPDELRGTALMGRIDRIDDLRGGVVELIDYKTGDVEVLKRGMKQPAEDTQLAFYAALVSRQSATPMTAPLTASYLGLDSSKGIVRAEHPEVETTARVLVDGLAADLDRLRNAAPLPALGEGSVCEHCAARGLCRRDDWAAA